MSGSPEFQILEWWAGLGRLGRSIISSLLLIISGVLWMVAPEGWPWLVCLSLGGLLLVAGLSIQ